MAKRVAAIALMLLGLQAFTACTLLNSDTERKMLTRSLKYLELLRLLISYPTLMRKIPETHLLFHKKNVIRFNTDLAF